MTLNYIYNEYWHSTLHILSLFIKLTDWNLNLGEADHYRQEDVYKRQVAESVIINIAIRTTRKAHGANVEVGDITADDVIIAVKTMKNGKGCGPEAIPMGCLLYTSRCV